MADAREPEQGAGSQEPPREQGAPSGEDLFDRWLAHRADGEGSAPRPRTYGVPRTGVHRPADEREDNADEAPRHDAVAEPVDAPAEETLDAPVEEREAPAPSHEVPLDPLAADEPGEALVDAPATPPSGRHPAAPATSTGLTDFEPVVLASVRRSEEQPAPTSRFGRRRRAEAPAPAAPDEEETATREDEISHEGGGAITEDEAAENRAAENQAAETEAAETEAESPAEAEHEASTEDTTPPPASAAAEVFAAFNGPAPDTAPDTAPVTGSPAESSSDGSPNEPRRPRARPAKPRAPKQPRTPTARPAVGAAVAKYAAGARELLDRSVRGAPEERGPSPTAPAPHAPDPATADPADQAPAAPGSTPADAARSTSAYDALRAEREAAVPPRPAVLPPDIDFRPRTLARRITSALLLVGIALTLLASWRAYDSRVQTDIGFAAILALFTGIVWAVRAGSVPTRMSLHGGLLEVRAQAGRFLFELTSAHTHLEQVGTPGRPGWKVLIHRRGMHPFEITRGMVDPHEFLDAVRYYRPDL